MFVAAECLQLITPIIVGLLIEDIQLHGVTQLNIDYLLMLLGLLIFKEIAFWAFHGPARVMEKSVAFQAGINYRAYLLKGTLGLGLRWHSEHDSGNTIDKANKAGEGIVHFGEITYQIIEILVKVFGTTFVLFWFSPWIGLLVFVFIIIAFVIMLQFDKRLGPQYRRLNEFANKANAAVFDALSNITTVKILFIEKPILHAVLARLKEPFKYYKANAKLNEWKWFSGNMIFQLIGAVPIAIYIYWGLKNGKHIDAGEISTLYLYLANLIFVFFSFGYFYEWMGIYRSQVLNAETIELAFSQQNKAERYKLSDWQTLEIQNLSFAYDQNSNEPALRNVNFKLKKGERIAVIGESGSGKTTFLKVLHGMYDAAHASIKCDDGPTKDLCFSEIDLQTMLVPQEPEIFSSTVRENITLGTDREERDLMHAVRIAAFDMVLDLLPKGLESVMNEKGVNLSGGQKQRLALSRALLFAAEKNLILLDESTSSVDPENEIEIYKNIWAAFQGKTIIASIHKLNLLRLFDRIVIFENGRIVDDGTFESLLKSNSGFKAAWENFVATNS